MSQVLTSNQSQVQSEQSSDNQKHKYTFARDLWNRFDLLKVHSTERRRLVEDFSKVIDEISNTEEQYAKRLSYISIQLEKISQVRGNHLCASLFTQLLQTYKKQSNEANISALRLKKEISLEIKSAVQNQNQVSNSLIQQGKNLQEGLQSRTQEIEKAKQSYIKYTQENEEQEMLQILYCNLKHISQEKKQRLENKIIGLKKKKFESEQKYKNSLNEYNEYLDQYYHELDIIMDKFQQQEDKRCEVVHKSIFELVNTACNYTKNSLAQFEKQQRNIASIDLFGGTQEFIKQNKYPMPLFQKLNFYPLQTFNQQALTKYKQKIGFIQDQTVQSQKNQQQQNNSTTNEYDDEPSMNKNEKDGDQKQEQTKQEEQKEDVQNNKTNQQLFQNIKLDENITYEKNTYLYEKVLEKKNQQYSQIFYDIIQNEQVPQILPQELQGYLFDNDGFEFSDEKTKFNKNKLNENQISDNISNDKKNEQTKDNNVNENKSQFIHHPGQKLVNRKLSDESKCIQISQIMLRAYKGLQINDQQLLSFYYLLENDSKYRYLFIQCFSQFRIQGKKIFTEVAYDQFIKLLNILINDCLKNFDSKILNKIMVLSLSYHKEVFKEEEEIINGQKSESNEVSQNNEINQQQTKLVKTKQFIQEGLLYHQLWQQKDYWETSIFDSIMDQIDQQQVYLSQTTESQQQTAQRERSILFAQISFQIENMLLFHHPLNQTKEVVEFNLKYFDLGKEQTAIIYERLKEYEQRNKIEAGTFDNLKQQAKNLFGI